MTRSRRSVQKPDSDDVGEGSPLEARAAPHTVDIPLRLLVLAPYQVFPPHGGGRMRVYHLIEASLASGNVVTFWEITSEKPQAPWGGHSSALRVIRSTALTRITRRDKVASMMSRYPEEVWARAAREIPDGIRIDDHDVAILMQPHVGRYVEEIRKSGVPIVLDCQNVEFDAAVRISRVAPRRISRIRLGVDALKWKRFERSVAAAASLIVAVSNQDAQEFRALVDRPVAVHPNGADVAGLRMQDHQANKSNRILMTGTLGYVPNMDAARWMINEILPIVRESVPTATLDLVGAAPPNWLSRQATGSVVVHGNVPEIQPFYEAADVFVAPLRAGGGTRLKILEALTIGIPVVSTTLGAAGLHVQDGQHLLLADNAAYFAEAVLKLLADVDLRRHLIEAGRTLVESEYDWRIIGRDYEQDLRTLVAGTSSTAPETATAR